MKRTILLSYLALIIVMLLAVSMAGRPKTEQEPAEASAPAVTAEPTAPPEKLPPAPSNITVLCGETAVEMDMSDYLVGVLAAEMPASFPAEALKAQAVAARTYAMYCASRGKHENAAVCTDYGCCQAWSSMDKLQTSWGAEYNKYLERLRQAVAATEGKYLSYEGEPVFAAFHSSSAGATESSGEIWSALPYLVSVKSPETENEVPNFVSRVECSALDFRDTLLYAEPSADFTGDESGWIGQIQRDGSGRVAAATLGGTEFKGTRLRELFKLRSTAFELEYTQQGFVFTVTGFGHGVGMSQYGAKTMAENGEDYAGILAHYYPGTTLAG